MSANLTGAREREGNEARSQRRMVIPDGGFRAERVVQHSFVDLGDSTRVALMLGPRSRGSFQEQLQEVLAGMVSILEAQRQPMVVTVQTVFLRDPQDQAECERLMRAFYGERQPVTNFVMQPPSCGAALAVEAWAIGGDDVRVEHFGPEVLAVSYDSVRWVYCGGIRPAATAGGVYAQTLDALAQLRQALNRAKSSLEQVVRTWFYLGEITELEGPLQRYQELNRARTDFYQDVRFGAAGAGAQLSHPIYPASTGIGMTGQGLALSCMAMETTRTDRFLTPLENPQQTPAYVYRPSYSPRSPKFSRAMALGLGDYVTTWISGTASIVDSESKYPGDVEKQTEQTIENIERLIAAENFARHGIKGAGATLQDLAKIRVYLKRAEDFEKCKAVCEKRFGPVPTIYATADVCRPELLVEIEGVAFSRCAWK
jgi:enamine deaminase RidA (YjgF/YER057c/UK114 family)